MADGTRQLQKVRIIPASLSDIEFVAMDMRDDEMAQWLALTDRDRYDPLLCARTLAAIPGPQYALIEPTGRPFAVGGLAEVRPRVLQCWAAARAWAWDAYWRDITGHARRLVREALASGEAHRVECVALASRTRAHDWYEAGLGMRYEGTLRCYFADGQDAVVYARTLGPAPPRRRKKEA